MSGAGISAESGISTFRDSGGLWEGHDVMEVASPVGWKKNPELVLEFYNQRRKQAHHCQPNIGHQIIADLDSYFDIQIITQNVDNLHERAGSDKVIHLHGELSKARSTVDPNLVYELGEKPILLGDKCEKNSQLRPHIVWFGEPVPAIELASAQVAMADILLVIGTSLAVYPAAGLLDYLPEDKPVIVVDPQIPEVPYRTKLHFIAEKASTGMKKCRELLMSRYM